MSQRHTRACQLATCLVAVVVTACAAEPDEPSASESNEGFALAPSKDEPALEEADPSSASEGLAGAADESMHVFGTDDRIPIVDTSKPPYSIMDGVPGSSGAGITGEGLDSDTIFAIDTSESYPYPEYNSSLLLGPTQVADIHRWVKAKRP